MSGTQKSNEGLGLWRALTLIGAVCVAIGLIGQVPVLSLLGAPLAIAGAIGLTVARRRQT
ncbi:hypothetical protein OG985_10695 [Streptomyces sp. NBC_00289]|uniref:hypothetical protein n=1 Tax=Streptomyces sp. NBC_00289 TaxID=2975703 RepID=UPI003244EAC9